MREKRTDEAAGYCERVAIFVPVTRLIVSGVGDDMASFSPKTHHLFRVADCGIFYFPVLSDRFTHPLG